MFVYELRGCEFKSRCCHDTMDFDWLTSEFLLTLYFCEALHIIVQVNRFLILTHSVIINITHIVHTVLDIKSKL